MEEGAVHKLQGKARPKSAEKEGRGRPAHAPKRSSETHQHRTMRERTDPARLKLKEEKPDTRAQGKQEEVVQPKRHKKGAARLTSKGRRFLLKRFKLDTAGKLRSSSLASRRNSEAHQQRTTMGESSAQAERESQTQKCRDRTMEEESAWLNAEEKKGGHISDTGCCKPNSINHEHLSYDHSNGDAATQPSQTRLLQCQRMQKEKLTGKLTVILKLKCTLQPEHIAESVVMQPKKFAQQRAFEREQG